MIRARAETPPDEPALVIEEVTAPDEIARCRAQYARAKKNSDWLQAHWGELLPHARGRFVAVAGQAAFVAPTAAEAWAWAAQAHPEDDGALVQYVSSRSGPRIYADRG
jgi:hypothetical protein